MTVYRNDKGRFREPTALEQDVDIRKDGDVEKLETMIKNGGVTFVLIYADWCGHCHRYLPMWADLEKTPGRTANMARVHYDMQEKIPSLVSAKIKGYPSVVKVKSDGTLESYQTEGDDATNALPTMRDKGAMTQEVTGSTNSMRQAGGGSCGVSQPVVGSPVSQQGGSVMDSFVTALRAAGPAVLLLATYSGLQTRRCRGKRTSRSKSFKSPKKVSRRGSSRKNRSFRSRSRV